MTKHFKKAENNTHLKRLVEGGLSIDNIAGAFGTSVGAIQRWLKDNESCPYWTKIAAEGIARRMGGNKQSTLLIHCPKEQEQTISKIAISLGATITPIKL